MTNILVHFIHCILTLFRLWSCIFKPLASFFKVLILRRILLSGSKISSLVKAIGIDHLCSSYRVCPTGGWHFMVCRGYWKGLFILKPQSLPNLVEVLIPNRQWSLTITEDEDLKAGCKSKIQIIYPDRGHTQTVGEAHKSSKGQATKDMSKNQAKGHNCRELLQKWMQTEITKKVIRSTGKLEFNRMIC